MILLRIYVSKSSIYWSVFYSAVVVKCLRHLNLRFKLETTICLEVGITYLQITSHTGTNQENGKRNFNLGKFLTIDELN